MVASAQTFTLLHGFDSTDGNQPYAGLVLATDGNLYGTTIYGGATNHGTIFRITRGGILTTLYSFCSQTDCPDGEVPFAGLIQANDGSLYGTTLMGGASGNGTVFKITLKGALTTLHSFCSESGCTDGGNPYAGLVQATDGNLYGTTESHGINSAGTVFKITPSGTLTTLYSFCSQVDCADGENPSAGLVQAANGRFYGTTVYGGDNTNTCGVECGTIFEITPGGRFTRLYSFCSQSDCVDGAHPRAALVQATDGSFYGTTADGGTNGYGTVFKINAAGKLTTLYSFCQQSGCTDGQTPYGALVQATDGNFYGTTLLGGSIANGTVFRINRAGTLTTIHSLDGADGTEPWAGLIQATNGSFYGTTIYGGATGFGTIFAMSVGLHAFVETQTTSGNVGAAVKILGTDLIGSTSVSFNGTAAVFNVVSGALIRTTVPAAATTGPVTVTTPTGTLTSNRPFRVTPRVIGFDPPSGSVGSSVKITGTGLTQTTHVSFGGAAASFSVDSDTQVTATVPAGAQTSTIQISTLGGFATSSTVFTVTQATSGVFTVTE
ncbi:MAG TPA: choice-of-anchor tandem repeat GloVer-containing protein [Candidatus Solibacter sp.]|nr:choice-of-anchor tandem repeat GloVer-containing protein [Candidatus Solibacter sp.]